MITTEMVYWIVMLDKISGAFLLFSVVFGFLLFLFTESNICTRIK